ncbi:MAG: DUF2071 domain-containing protein [Chloroflexota bacterium]|nr:DUF2071 domain-containing protein [Chloroflexota bacterium]
MQIPVIQGVIARRILVNYRVDPAVLARLLPAPFRPKLIDGVGVAGICLIRLEALRPRRLPAWLGLSSENAAHRIAVVWEEAGQRREGVYIPRRDTNRWFNTLAGGRIFPGAHQHARFTVAETGSHYRVALDSDDRQTHVLVDGQAAADVPAGSVFSSLAAASAFFRPGALGYSPTGDAQRLSALELQTRTWQMHALAVDQVESSFFADRARFPAGSATFDCALLMRNIAHEWHSRGYLACAS